GKVEGELDGIMVKCNSKSTFWYRPDKLTAGGASTPKSRDDLNSLITTLQGKGDATPLALGAKDSWTLTDWLEEVYLRQNGPDAYKKLFSADGDCAGPTVSKALDTMKEVLTD